MAVSNSFSRFLIVNGQPIIIKHDGLNSSQSFTNDILQQAINDVAVTDTLSNVINSNSNENDTVISNIDMNVENSTVNHYITEFSSDQSSEDASTIKLTVEQASELGLHFTMDHLNDNRPIDLNSKRGSIEGTSKHSQFIISNTDSIPLNNTDCVKMQCDLEINDSQENSSLLNQFQGDSAPSEQEFTLVPHIVNGALTYTLQLSNDIITQSSNNELLRINDSSLTQESGLADHQLRFDLASLPDSSDLPFISSLGLVSNKITENSVQNRSENEISNQSFGIVSCNPENITFLSLTDTMPGSNSNQTTQTTNTTSQQLKFSSKLYNPIDGKSTNKKVLNQPRESLLLKQSNTPSNVQNVVRLKSKIKQVDKLSSLSDSCIPSKKVMSESVESNLNVICEQSEGNKCLQELSSVLEKNQRKVDSISMNGDTLSDITGINDKCSEDSLDGTTNTPTIITPCVGDVPEKVSDVLSRIPIKTNCNKPLGSNENPIKLAQQGSTFHSMQALTEDHISKITPILQGNIDAKIGSKNVMYDPASNTRVIYRIISPAEVHLGRRSDFPRRRGRPRKEHIAERQTEETKGVPTPRKLFPRTRSGRLSRPPKHMVRDYKHIRRPEADDSDGGYSDYQSDNGEEGTNNLDTAPVELLPGLVVTRKNQKRNISAGNVCPTCGKIYLGYDRMKRHFDNYPDHGSIEYLNTVRNSNPDSEAETHRLENGNTFWKKGSGRRRGRGTADKRTNLKEALEWCTPQEVADITGPTVAGVLSLWQLLLLRVDSVKRDSRVATLYNELCQLFTTLRLMSHKLFRPLDHPLPPDTKHITVQVENEMSGVLNLPCGVYLASDEDFDKILVPNLQEEPSSNQEQSSILEKQVNPSTPLVEKKPQEKSLQEPKEMTIDDVPQPFLEEMICDSGMVNVDEIVSERLQNFTGSQSSSVDELMKGLNELEQRNKLETDDLMEGFSIVSRRTHVSASTEDLMKSLEHFESDLNHSDAPSTLDRETFDRVSSVDTLDFEVLSREYHSSNR